MNENTKKRLVSILWAILAVGLSALMSYVFTDTNSAWYSSLCLPAFLPPASVFTIVWTVLYILLTVGLGRLIMSGNREAIFGFAAFLTLCALWNYAFFVLHNSLAGLVIMILCLVSVIYTIRYTWKTDRFSTVILLLFLAWIAFATVLNYTIYMAN